MNVITYGKQFFWTIFVIGCSYSGFLLQAQNNSGISFNQTEWEIGDIWVHEKQSELNLNGSILIDGKVVQTPPTVQNKKFSRTSLTVKGIEGGQPKTIEIKILDGWESKDGSAKKKPLDPNWLKKTYQGNSGNPDLTLAIVGANDIEEKEQEFLDPHVGHLLGRGLPNSEDVLFTALKGKEWPLGSEIPLTVDQAKIVFVGMAANEVDQWSIDGFSMILREIKIIDRDPCAVFFVEMDMINKKPNQLLKIRMKSELAVSLETSRWLSLSSQVNMSGMRDAENKGRPYQIKSVGTGSEMETWKKQKPISTEHP